MSTEGITFVSQWIDSHVTQIVKDIQNNILIIVLSGNEQPSVLHDAKDVPFLSKPFITGQLIRLTKALRSASQ
jgi:hypothetical protein